MTWDIEGPAHRTGSLLLDLPTCSLGSAPCYIFSSLSFPRSEKSQRAGPAKASVNA